MLGKKFYARSLHIRPAPDLIFKISMISAIGPYCCFFPVFHIE